MGRRYGLNPGCNDNSLVSQLALKIDVDTLRDMLDGVPALVSVLKKYCAQATFLFNPGPGNIGSGLRRLLLLHR